MEEIRVDVEENIADEEKERSSLLSLAKNETPQILEALPGSELTPGSRELHHVESRNLSPEERLLSQASEATKKINEYIKVRELNSGEVIMFILSLNHILDKSQNIILPELLKLKEEQKTAVKEPIKIFRHIIKTGENFLQTFIEDVAEDIEVTDQTLDQLKNIPVITNMLKNNVLTRLEKNKLEKSVRAIEKLINIYDFVLSDQLARLGLERDALNEGNK